jgi:hypothetical protein
MDRYIPLFQDGVQHAIQLGYVAPTDPTTGSLCLQCGSVVASRWLHDVYHGLGEEEE